MVRGKAWQDYWFHRYGEKIAFITNIFISKAAKQKH